MISRMVHTTPFRLIALVLATVLAVVAATPAKAEAVDALAIVAIAGLVVAGIILIAYLVVANVKGSKRRADSDRLLWMACMGDECTAIPAQTAAAIAGAALPLIDRQGP
jgi:hypothetical protein